jgi:hypothetical protein
MQVTCHTTHPSAQSTSSATLWPLNIYHFPISSIAREISLFRENTNWQVKIWKKKHALRKVWNNRRFHHLFSDGSTGTVIQIVTPSTMATTVTCTTRSSQHLGQIRYKAVNCIETHFSFLTLFCQQTLISLSENEVWTHLLLQSILYGSTAVVYRRLLLQDTGQWRERGVQAPLAPSFATDGQWP